jgi:ribonuclease Z
MDKTIELYWSGESWQIPGTCWYIIGYSRSSYRTGFYIKSLDLMIDAGPQKVGNPSTILITHCHADHIASIPFTLLGNKSLSKPNIFVPKESIDKLHNYINSLFTLNDNEIFYEKTANYIPITGNQIFEDYLAKKIKINIKTFKCDHGVPTFAYGISTKKYLLKEEYLKYSPEQLSILRKCNAPILYNKSRDHIVFVWDTSIEIFKTSPEILNYDTIMIECTFLHDEDYEQSIIKKHIHWKSLEPYVVNNPDKMFVLVHFSMRYKEEEIKKFFETINLPNVKPWLQLQTS